VTTATTSNPAFRNQPLVADLSATRTMTRGGVTVKTALFLALVVLGGAWGWASATAPVAGDMGSGYGNTTVTIPGGFWLASFGALFVGIFAAFNPRLAAPLGAVYAVLQGYVLGAVSAAFEAQTEGIVGAAVLTTLCVFVVALLLYATGIIKPTRRLAFGVAAGIGGLMLLYLFIAVLAIFDWEWLYSDEFRTIGVVVSLIAVVLAALSLTLDFAAIAEGVRVGAPRQMEWYSAYSLMVTLIWLYISVLRLLAWMAGES
jgi:uncharacterized YccA/Bax inhibitor family protein